jgi:Protein of unknown function, DUF480
MDRDLAPNEVRVLGCLIEKQRTTPDAYPLSLNALRLACNQSTNRDPVVAYDEDTVRDALHRLGRRRYTRLASGHGSRASKYRHLLDEALGLDAAEQAVLAVLMLRGPQTPGELKQRTERMQPFAGRARRRSATATGSPRTWRMPRSRPPPRRPRPSSRRRRAATSAWTGSRPRWRSCASSSPRCAANWVSRCPAFRGCERG